ncbi:uncharacterized protein LOC131334114 [Rhododendron vialii]|uniref:uncharacterized protein LOC131334114 n=1 Tax=Rhododendron vialii TaxID=182163 RepID=UPI00265E98DA|nr:uncharacterized protein LOC131334114 [Rhododendron vialii]
MAATSFPPINTTGTVGSFRAASQVPSLSLSPSGVDPVPTCMSFSILVHWVKTVLVDCLLHGMRIVSRSFSRNMERSRKFSLLVICHLPSKGFWICYLRYP